LISSADTLKTLDSSDAFVVSFTVDPSSPSRSYYSYKQSNH
jgi:hypothetical protein